MNIFFVDRNPVLAAQSLCDKHIVRLITEAGILLCGVHHRLKFKYPNIRPPYLTGPIINGKLVSWLYESLSNYNWCVNYALEIAKEYTKRYNKIHASQKVIEWCKEHQPDIPDIGLTKMPQIMPTQYMQNDTIQAYRNSCIQEKTKFAKWKLNNKPNWWK